jgi:hypothetical protein
VDPVATSNALKPGCSHRNADKLRGNKSVLAGIYIIIKAAYAVVKAAYALYVPVASSRADEGRQDLEHPRMEIPYKILFTTRPR